MMLVPVPGHNPGDLTAAGNLGAFIDRAVLGQNHLWGQSKTVGSGGAAEHRAGDREHAAWGW